MPKTAPPIWHVPHARNTFFTGRAETLDHLHRALIATGKAALSGMGGVGKTQTAAEYAYRHRGEYGAVLWAKADSEESLRTDLAAITVTLELPEKDEADRDKAAAAVKRWLGENSGWLLILDNADELTLISDLLAPEWGGHLLLTTRAHATGAVQKADVTEMPAEEGTLFLLRRAKLIALDDPLESATEADAELAAEITRELGGLPLALDQAGAFVEEMSSSLSEYLELYRREGAQLRAARGGIAADHDPVTITFSLAFRQVEAASAPSADLLRACAFLAPDAIPEEIFSEGAAKLGENLAPVAGGGINLVKVIGEAGRFSLIRRNAKSRTIEIHRLVQQVILDEMDGVERRRWAERVVRALNIAFPGVRHNDWPLCEKFLPHAQGAANLIEEYGFKLNEAARLLNEAGGYCHERARYALAESMWVHSLRIREETLEPNHLDIARSLHNLGGLYDKQGRYTEAEPMLQRALSIREEALGPDHQDVALTLDSLGAFYDGQGRYGDAEKLCKRALSVYEKVLGTDHPDVGRCLNNLAVTLLRQGRYTEAEPMLQRALSIREEALGPDHPGLANTLINLAVLYRNQSKHVEAGSLYERALANIEKALGPDHPNVATALNNLAFLYNVQGKYDEAEPLFKRVVSIFGKVFGPDHPELALSINNLAGTYVQMGRYVDAEPLFAEALRITKKALGPNHPRTNTIQRNYDQVIRLKG